MQHGAIPPTDITGENDAPLFLALNDTYPDHSPSQNMPRVEESSFDAGSDFYRIIVFDVGKQGECRLGIGDGIEGDFRIGSFLAFPDMSLFLISGVFFLYMRRIQQDDFSNIGGGGCTVDPALESLVPQFGAQAGVVQVGVSD